MNIIENIFGCFKLLILNFDETLDKEIIEYFKTYVEKVIDNNTKARNEGDYEDIIYTEQAEREIIEYCINKGYNIITNFSERIATIRLDCKLNNISKVKLDHVSINKDGSIGIRGEIEK